MRLLVWVDDLMDPDLIDLYLTPIWEKVPQFRATVYAIPNKLGEIHELRLKYPWLVFGIHGWEHTRGECGPWTDEQAHDLIGRALKMGYDPVFKAPGWIHTEAAELACRDLGVVLHHHDELKIDTQGLKVFPGTARRLLTSAQCQTLSGHFYRAGVDNFIGDHPGFDPLSLKFVKEFLTPLDLAEPVK